MGDRGQRVSIGWMDDEKHRSLLNEKEFTVMTYNILADVYSREPGYEYCPEHVVSFEARLKAIIGEISAVSPDVLCLQEVEENYYKDSLKPSMTNLGYDGVNMSYKIYEGRGVGLALFFKASKLQLTTYEKYISKEVIHDLLTRADIPADQRAAIKKHAERTQGFQIVKLLHLPSNRHLTLGNVHIKWCEFKLPALSCLETACALRHLQRTAGQDAFILTGDFNSTPDFITYRMLAGERFTQETDYWHNMPQFPMYEWTGCGESNPNEARSFCSTSLLDTVPGASNIGQDRIEADKVLAQHFTKMLQADAPLTSAYKEFTGHEPDVTNCDGGAWVGYIHQVCLDYIWYPSQQLTVRDVLRTPSVEEIRRSHALPSVSFPSDHIPIAACFEFL